MTDAREQILAALNDMGLPYREMEHPAAHTIEDCRYAEQALSCTVPKNLFLTPRNLSAFYLCLVRPGALFRTADVSKQIGSSRLSFGPEDKLYDMLRTHPGAVSPLGLIFDRDARVTLLMDEQLRDLPVLGFHPNDNTRTVAMAGRDFFNGFLKSIGRRITWITLPDKGEA